MGQLEEFIEYAKIHIISLEQDLETSFLGEGYESLNGQIIATSHLLSVAEGILNDKPVGGMDHVDKLQR
jgi:hypothetical protein